MNICDEETKTSENVWHKLHNETIIQTYHKFLVTWDVRHIKHTDARKTQGFHKSTPEKERNTFLRCPNKKKKYRRSRGERISK